jgi:hypothetical protein
MLPAERFGYLASNNLDPVPCVRRDASCWPKKKKKTSLVGMQMTTYFMTAEKKKQGTVHCTGYRATSQAETDFRPNLRHDRDWQLCLAR